MTKPPAKQSFHSAAATPRKLGEELLEHMTGRSFCNVSDCMTLVKAGADLTLCDDQGMTALHWAAEQAQSAELLQAMIARGAVVDAQLPANGKTPLILAAQKSAPYIVKPLLRAGADIHLTDSWGTSALHYAASSFKPEKTIRLLLAAGADASATSRCGNSVLHHLGKMEEHAHLFDILVQHGADIDAQDGSSDGASILQYAAQFGQKEQVAFLLEKGANTQLRGRVPGSLTAEELARQNGYTDIADMIHEHDTAPLRRQQEKEARLRKIACDALEKKAAKGLPLETAIKPCPRPVFRARHVPKQRPL